jgi:glyoxylase-like metal-dependent hydrolase (beta-lactamase superfamily II)
VTERSRVEPLVDEGLGNSSFLVDLGDGRALALDPSRHPGGYLEVAERRGLRIAYTVETHLHADFVSGSRELAQLGAQVIAPAAAGLEFPAQGLNCVISFCFRLRFDVTGNLENFLVFRVN